MRFLSVDLLGTGKTNAENQSADGAAEDDDPAFGFGGSLRDRGLVENFKLFGLLAVFQLYSGIGALPHAVDFFKIATSEHRLQTKLLVLFFTGGHGGEGPLQVRAERSASEKAFL